MAKREVIDEEPFDIDLEGEEGEDIDLDSEGSEEEEPRKRATEAEEEDGQITDKELEDWKKERDRLRVENSNLRANAAEAEEIARAAIEQIETISSSTTKTKTTQQKADIVKEIADVRKALRTAFEDGDSEKHADLTEKLADLKGQERLLTVIEEQQEAAAKQQRTQNGLPRVQRPQPHAKAIAWKERNKWFDTNEEARMAAVAIGGTLERQGVSPATDDYYTMIDERMKKRYPEIYEEEPPRRKETPPVRGVEREGGGARKTGRKVRLTPLQVKMAKRWGLTPEAVAKEVLKQRRREEEAR